MTKFFVLMDGVGDRRIKALGNKTPLEAAKTDALDYFAKKGVNGRVITVRKDIAPESDVAIMALLGYDPFIYHRGRGPIEAIGADIKLKKGWCVLRANFATVKGKKIVDRRVGRSLTSREARKLSEEIDKKVKLKVPFKFHHTIEHRGVLVLEGNLSDKVTNTDPAYERVKGLGVASEKPKKKLVKCRAMERDRKAFETARLINEFSKQAREVLEKSKVNKRRKKERKLIANYILLRDAGIDVPKVKPLEGRWAAVVGMPLEKGLARIAGMKTLPFNYPELRKGERITDNFFRKTKAEIENAKGYIKKYREKFDGFYIHFKETDIMGHDGDYKNKKKMIALIDKEFFGWLKDNFQAYDLVLVTGDHSTPCALKNHSADPVPLIVYGMGLVSDNEKRFSEHNNGKLGLLKGIEVMKLFEEMK